MSGKQKSKRQLSWVCASLSRPVKLSGHIAVHSFLPDAEITNAWIYISARPTPSVRGITTTCRSQWPRAQMGGYATTSFLWLWGSNPVRGNRRPSFEGVVCCLITRPEEFHRVWCVWVWSWRPVRGGHDQESGRSATRKKVATTYLFSNVFRCVDTVQSCNSISTILSNLLPSPSVLWRQR
jgi:hypothetical protein